MSAIAIWAFRNWAGIYNHCCVPQPHDHHVCVLQLVYDRVNGERGNKIVSCDHMMFCLMTTALHLMTEEQVKP